MVMCKNQKPFHITMIKFHFVFLYLAVIGVTLWGVHCVSPEDQSALMDTLKPLAGECIKDCNLTEEDFKKDDMHPCYKKCLLNKIGLLNDAGAYDHGEVKKQIRMFVEDTDKTNKLLNMLDDCFDGNEKMKEDKDEEAKRIDMIFECLKNSQSR